MSETDPAQTRTWLDGLRRGDPASMEALIRAWQGPLFGYLMRFVGNSHTAEDLFQEVFLKVHLNLDSLPDAHGFGPWLYRIAHNLAVDTLRHSAFERVDQDRVLRAAAPPASSSQDGRDQLLARAILDLPEAQRSVVCLRLYGGFTFAQISRIVEAPLNTVLGRMHLATRSLRKCMGQGDTHGL